MTSTRYRWTDEDVRRPGPRNRNARLPLFDRGPQQPRQEHAACDDRRPSRVCLLEHGVQQRFHVWDNVTKIRSNTLTVFLVDRGRTIAIFVGLNSICCTSNADDLTPPVPIRFPAATAYGLAVGKTGHRRMDVHVGLHQGRAILCSHRSLLLWRNKGNEDPFTAMRSGPSRRSG